MILIIDADSITASSLARLLRYNGHEAEVIPSASEALALFNTRRPTAIIMELLLPHINGFQLLKSIRADPEFSHIPIIIYTAEISHAAADQALQHGAADVIIKGTAGTRSLLTRIERLLPEK